MPPSEARDEVALLKAHLDRGHWRRLTSPLLPFAIWGDPDWWADARWTCLRQMAVWMMLQRGTDYWDFGPYAGWRNAADLLGYLWPAPYHTRERLALEVCIAFPAEEPMPF